jgi:TRAP transporter TAXI family solute receptor
VSIGARESGTVVTTKRLLAVAGIDPDTGIQPSLLGLDDSAAALEAGTVDAFFFSGGLPVGRVRQLSTRMPLRLVPLGQYASALRTTHGQFYAEHTVPESTYGLPPVSTIGIPNYLVVSADLPERTGYALTRLLFDDQAELEKAHPVVARLNPREAIYTYPLALHPGATRYFREIKP